MQQVVDEVNGFEHDLKTAAGRAKTISLASKVAKIKVKYDECGKDLVSGWKENAKKVDKARKKMRDQLDDLKVLARKPVTDWETEQEKIKADKLAAAEVEKLNVQHEMALLLNKEFDRDAEDARLKLEAEQKIEDKRLDDLRIKNEARIAKEAAEAATAKAERLAQQAIDDAQAAKQKAIDDKIKADNALIESQAEQKRLTAQAEQTRLNNEWLAYISEAYRINDDINAQIQRDYLAGIAETKRLAAIETERLAGIERQRIIEADKKATQDKLESDKKHVGSVRGEIKVHLMESLGVDEAMAIKIVKSLLKTKRVTINY